MYLIQILLVHYCPESSRILFCTKLDIFNAFDKSLLWQSVVQI